MSTRAQAQPKVGECRPGDARLIAAAPDLLEIARRLSLATEEGDDLAQSTHWFNARTQRVHCKGSFLDLIEAARAAILKATGERP